MFMSSYFPLIKFMVGIRPFTETNSLSGNCFIFKKKNYFYKLFLNRWVLLLNYFCLNFWISIWAKIKILNYNKGKLFKVFFMYKNGKTRLKIIQFMVSLRKELQELKPFKVILLRNVPTSYWLNFQSLLAVEKRFSIPPKIGRFWFFGFSTLI
jgi:hypothetical protein